MRWLRSSALTLAAGYIGLGLAALGLFAAPLWYAWRTTIDEGRVEILQSDAQRFAEVFRREGAEGLISFINARVGMQIAGERLLLLTDPTLKPLAGNLSAWPQTVPTQPGSYTVRIDVGNGPADVAVVYEALPGGYHVLVGRDTSRFRPLEQRFWYALAGAVAILSILGVCGGVLIRRALMARIFGIRKSMADIIHSDLSLRLPTQRGGDELNTLAQTINSMFDQIEQLLHGVRNVSNAIAHDLRTPLAELRSRLEELALTKPSPEQTFADIDAAVADVDRVIRIFNALLRLAEIDSGMRRSGFIGLDVTEIAAAAVEFYQPAAELKGSMVVLKGGTARSRGDPLLLAQALGNLIDNALKYSPDGGVITVTVEPAENGDVIITVADRGPGIADAEKPKVIERFYRGDPSRGTPGVGLGLSLVDAVARLHGSPLELEDNQPGLRARMVLKQDAPQIRRATPAAPVPGNLGQEPAFR